MRIYSRWVLRHPSSLARELVRRFLPSFVRMSDRYVYLDTSAFVKLCWPEPESVALYALLRSWPLRVSAALLYTEALRAAQRQPASRISKVQTILRRIALIEVDRALFRQAGMLLPPDIRSLDAVHLAAETGVARARTTASAIQGTAVRPPAARTNRAGRSPSSWPSRPPASEPIGSAPHSTS